MTSDDSPYGDTCCVAEGLAADDDDDGHYRERALVTDKSTSEQFKLLDSVKAECSTMTEQSALVSCADVDAEAAKKRQLWIVVRHHLSPLPFTSGNSLQFGLLFHQSVFMLMCNQQ